MSTNFKRVNLMLDEAVLARLRRAAQAEHVSVSSMARTLLARQLGALVDDDSLHRIRSLRDNLGSLPDSALGIRQDRDAGW